MIAGSDPRAVAAEGRDRGLYGNGSGDMPQKVYYRERTDECEKIPARDTS